MLQVSLVPHSLLYIPMIPMLSSVAIKSPPANWRAFDGFCAEGATARVTSPSTCRPCRRRGRLPGQPSAQESQPPSFSGEQETSDRSCILQCRGGYLGGIDDASLDQVFEVAGGCRCSRSAAVLTRAPWPPTTAPSSPGIGDDLGRSGSSSERSDEFWRADLLIAFQGLDQLVNRGDGANQSNTASGDDTFLDSSARGVESILNASLLFLELVSVAAPTLMMATPPTSLARRSCSFSFA